MGTKKKKKKRKNSKVSPTTEFCFCVFPWMNDYPLQKRFSNYSFLKKIPFLFDIGFDKILSLDWLIILLFSYCIGECILVLSSNFLLVVPGYTIMEFSTAFISSTLHDLEHSIIISHRWSVDKSANVQKIIFLLQEHMYQLINSKSEEKAFPLLV